MTAKVGFSWQHLGAFIYTGQNLTQDRLAQFAGIHGRTIAPVIYGDDVAGPWNVLNLELLREWCRPLGIRVGAQVNCDGSDPYKIAAEAGEIIDDHGLDPVILDAEAAYKGSTDMSFLAHAFRQRYPRGTKAIGVTTNELNDSVVYNGRKGATLKATDLSFRDYNIHVLPQWYSAPRYNGCYTDPVCNMKWLEVEGMKDNLRDPGYSDRRAVALGHVHAAVEGTGIENADLATSLEKCRQAKQHSLGPGLWLYTLEAAPPSDLPLIGQYYFVLYN